MLIEADCLDPLLKQARLAKSKQKRKEKKGLERTSGSKSGIGE